MTFEQWLENTSERNFADWNGQGYVWISSRQIDILGQDYKANIIWINGRRLRKVHYVNYMRSAIYTNAWSLLSLITHIVRAESWWLYFRYRCTATLQLWGVLKWNEEMNFPLNDFLRQIDNKINQVMGRW